MKNLYKLFLIFFLIINLAVASSTPFEVVKKQLDNNILWLITKHPNEKSVLAKFGLPQLSEDHKHYYALNDFKYSLCLQYSKTGLIYLNYKMPGNTKIAIKDFIHYLKAEDFSLYPTDGHEKGRFLSVFLKKENIQLIFYNNSDKTLERIIYDKR